MGLRCGLARACSGAREQKHLRTHRVQRHSRGQRPGVAKTGNDRNTSPQRLIMNITAANWAQNVIAGDMPQLPTSGQWRCLVLEDGKFWFAPEKISNAVFTCSKFPNRGANGCPLQLPWPVVVYILAALGKSTSVRKLSPWCGFQPRSHPTRPSSVVDLSATPSALSRAGSRSSPRPAIASSSFKNHCSA